MGIDHSFLRKACSDKIPAQITKIYYVIRITAVTQYIAVKLTAPGGALLKTESVHWHWTDLKGESAGPCRGNPKLKNKEGIVRASELISIPE